MIAQAIPINLQSNRVLSEYDVFIHTSYGPRIPTHANILVCLQFRFNIMFCYIRFCRCLQFFPFLFWKINNEKALVSPIWRHDRSTTESSGFREEICSQNFDGMLNPALTQTSYPQSNFRGMMKCFACLGFCGNTLASNLHRRMRWGLQVEGIPWQDEDHQWEACLHLPFISEYWEIYPIFL